MGKEYEYSQNTFQKTPHLTGNGRRGCKQLQPWPHCLCQPEFKPRELGKTERGGQQQQRKTEKVLISKFLLNQYISVPRWIPAEPVKIDVDCRYSNLIGSWKTTFISRHGRDITAFESVRLVAWHPISFLICKLGTGLHISGQLRINWDDMFVGKQVLNKSHSPLFH